MDTTLKKKVERINQLVEVLMKRNGVMIKDLAILCGVSEMTIRRDLEVLKQQGIVLNMNGAAIYNPNNNHRLEDETTYSLALATTANVKEKERIGMYAASLIDDGECVIIDNGSTTEHVAQHLNMNLKATILTCNLNIVNQLCNKLNIDIIFGGGYYHADTRMFESPESISLIRKTRASKVFISAMGVHETLGVTCASNYELATKQAIIQSGAECILLVDSSKFDSVRTCFFSEIEEFQKIITDKNISAKWESHILERGIELVKV